MMFGLLPGPRRLSRPPAEVCRDIQRDRVTLCETVLLREDLDPAFMERLARAFAFARSARRIAAELQEFCERDPRAAIAWRWWFDTTPGRRPVAALDELLVLESERRIPCCGPAASVGRAREDVRALVERVLELSAGDQAITCAPSYQNVAAGLLERVRSSRSGVGKRKTLCPNAATFASRGGAVSRSVHVDVHPVHVEGIVTLFTRASRGPELRGADVGA